MIIRKAVFAKSAVDESGIPEGASPEFALCGRSNVGKSSFVNMLADNGSLAKTSKEPGRTRLINYFVFNDGEFVLVDLPGYGFARVSKEEKEKWGDMIGNYLSGGKNLTGAFLLLDIRHAPSADDIVMVNYLHNTATPFVIIATKVDKLPKSQILRQKRALAQSLRVGEDNIIAVSSQTKEGREKVLERIESIISNR